MTAIRADYRTTKHVPSRKCYQLVMEVPEEDFPSVCQILGYPRTGENTYVGIALLAEDTIKTSSDIPYTLGNGNSNIAQQTEGEKLRTRAVMLCKDSGFQYYIHYKYKFQNSGFPSKGEHQTSEQWCISTIYHYCNIKSRSELATNQEAQTKFKELLAKFDSWKLESQYADNLNRY